MASKQDFTMEEWAKVRQSVMLTSLAVTAADPSGLFGTLKEAFAGGKALMAAKSDAEAGELVKAVVADVESPAVQKEMREGMKELFRGAKPAEMTQRSIELLREVGSILDAKAPDEAAAFKSWLQGISQQVAEASKEGGFLGFGGVEVSENEKATIDEVGRALNIAT